MTDRTVTLTYSTRAIKTQSQKRKRSQWNRRK